MPKFNRLYNRILDEPPRKTTHLNETPSFVLEYFDVSVQYFCPQNRKNARLEEKIFLLLICVEKFVGIYRHANVSLSGK